jgi:Ni2+-binding GTPase involved in maturation of urease and hydrogenase
MKHLKHAYEILVVTPDLLLKHQDENNCNIHMETTKTLRNICLKHLQKHMQLPDETLANIRLKK